MIQSQQVAVQVALLAVCARQIERRVGQAGERVGIVDLLLQALVASSTLSEKSLDSATAPG
jgi:hypothetical protein